MLGFKSEKLAYTIKKQLSLLLQKGKIKDPRISKMMTITKVVMSSDLKIANVYVSIYDAGTRHIETHLRGLKSSVYFIRKLLSKSIRLKYVPIIYFYVDKDFHKIDELCNRFNQIESEKIKSEEI